MRRVVTGHDAAGKAIVLFDGEIDMLLDDSEVHFRCRIAFVLVDAREP